MHFDDVCRQGMVGPEWAPYNAEKPFELPNSIASGKEHSEGQLVA